MKRSAPIRALHAAAALFLLSSAVAAVAPEASVVPGQADCAGSPDHATYRTCLEKQAKARAAIVIAAEQHVLDTIDHWDEKAQARQNARALFDASRKMFQANRTATCEVAAAAAAGGSSASELRLRCQEELDLEWLAYLQNMTARSTPWKPGTP